MALLPLLEVAPDGLHEGVVHLGGRTAVELIHCSPCTALAEQPWHPPGAISSRAAGCWDLQLALLWKGDGAKVLSFFESV